MDISNIEHIGIAVKSLDQSIPTIEKLLNINCYKREVVADQNVTTAFFKIGDTKLELLEPINGEGPIQKFIDSRGEGLHHIAFKVNGCNEALSSAKSNGFRLIDQESRPGAENMHIGFLNPKKTFGTLIEFCSDIK